MNTEPIHFGCPDCGRDCMLVPVLKGGTSALHSDLRVGQQVKHQEPTCRTWRRLMGPESTQQTRADFLKLAVACNRNLHDDPHVSWKEGEQAAKVFSDAPKEDTFTGRYVDLSDADKPN